jgi:hypothetical protein
MRSGKMTSGRKWKGNQTYLDPWTCSTWLGLLGYQKEEKCWREEKRKNGSGMKVKEFIVLVSHKKMTVARVRPMKMTAVRVRGVPTWGSRNEE